MKAGEYIADSLTQAEMVARQNLAIRLLNERLQQAQADLRSAVGARNAAQDRAEQLRRTLGGVQQQVIRLKAEIARLAGPTARGEYQADEAFGA